jgi:hypothetical protein
VGGQEFFTLDDKSMQESIDFQMRLLLALKRGLIEPPATHLLRCQLRIERGKIDAKLRNNLLI